MSAAGVCQTDAFTLSGADPDGLVPGDPGSRGGGIVEEVGAGVTRPASPAITSFRSTCPNAASASTADPARPINANACWRLRHEDSCPTARRASHAWQGACCTTWVPAPSPSIRVARDRPRQDRPSAHRSTRCACSAASSRPARRGARYREGRCRVERGGIRSGRRRAFRGAGRGHGAGVSRIIAVDLNPIKWALAEVARCDGLRQSQGSRRPIQQVILELTRGGVDYSFECIGNVHAMRSALESLPRRMGRIGHHRRRRRRPGNLDAAALSSSSGRVWRGSIFGGVKGRSQLPAYVSATSRAR